MFLATFLSAITVQNNWKVDATSSFLFLFGKFNSITIILLHSLHEKERTKLVKFVRIPPLVAPKLYLWNYTGYILIVLSGVGMMWAVEKHFKLHHVLSPLKQSLYPTKIEVSSTYILTFLYLLYISFYTKQIKLFSIWL